MLAALAWKPFDERLKSIIQRFEDHREYLSRRAQTASRVEAARERSEAAVHRKMLEDLSQDLRKELRRKQNDALGEFCQTFCDFRKLIEHVQSKQ